MANNNNRPVYGIGQPLRNLFPSPIISTRAPLTTDRLYPLGQVWTNKSANTAYLLTSVVANIATWQEITNAGGGGAIAGTSLTITPGPTALTGQFTVTSGAALPVSIGADATDHNVTIGSQTGVSTLTLQSGTGDINLSPANTGDVKIGTATQTAASAIIIGQTALGQPISIGGTVNTVAQSVSIANGASAANSTVSILSGIGTAGAATLALGNNPRVTTIGLGDVAPSAARVTRINGGNSAQNDTVAILSGNPSANAQTVSILSGTPTGGTQVLNLGAQTTNPIAINMGSGTGLATVQIANGAAANVVTVGSTNGAAATTLQAGTGGLALNAAGIVSMAPVTDTQASPSATSIIGARVGKATFTGFTTAAAGIQAFTITNALVTAASGILVSAHNEGANDAKMTVSRVLAGAGTFDVVLTNNGAAALNGNVVITFWVID